MCGARGLTAAAGAPTMQAAGVCGPEDGVGVASHGGGEAGSDRVVVREAWGREGPRQPWLFSRPGVTSRMLWFLVTWVPRLGAGI